MKYFHVRDEVDGAMPAEIGVLLWRLMPGMWGSFAIRGNPGQDGRYAPAADDARGNIRIELLPNVKTTLFPLKNHLIFVVTNQAGVKRGRFTLAQVETAMAELDRQLDGILTAWQICPHDDADRCECRKPKGGLITELERFTASISGLDDGGRSGDRRGRRTRRRCWQVCLGTRLFQLGIASRAIIPSAYRSPCASGLTRRRSRGDD